MMGGGMSGEEITPVVRAAGNKARAGPDHLAGPCRRVALVGSRTKTASTFASSTFQPSSVAVELHKYCSSNASKF
jgi:hypothetical protein